MFGFITDVFRTVWTQDLPTLRNWVLYGTLQPAVALPGPVADEQMVDEDDAIYDNEPESFDEMDSAEVYFDEDAYEEFENMHEQLDRGDIEYGLINRFFELNGIAARISPFDAGYAANSFFCYNIQMAKSRKTGRYTQWSSIEKLADELETFLHQQRISDGALAAAVATGVISPDFETAVRTVRQPMSIEVNRIDPYPLLLDLDSLDNIGWIQDTYTAYAGLSYVNGEEFPIVWDPTNPDQGALLIAGRRGSGKSNLLCTVVATLALSTSPDEMALFLVDGKNDDLRMFMDLPHTRVFAYEPDDCLSVIAEVASIIDERIESDKEPETRVVLVIDELVSVMRTNDREQEKEIERHLSRIVQMGRSLCVDIICCTQKPLAKVMGPFVKSNLAHRYIGALTSATDASNVVDVPGSGAEKLGGAGAFLVVSNGKARRFQAPLIEDANELIEAICEKWGFDEEDDYTQAPKTVMDRELHRVFEEYYSGAMDNHGRPTLDSGGIKAGIEVINDGIFPAKGRQRQELSNTVKERLSEWLKEGVRGVSTSVGHPNDKGVHLGNVDTLELADGHPADTLGTPSRTPSKSRWISDLPVAVKPCFVNTTTKH